MAEHILDDVAALERLYGEPAEVSVIKEIDHIHPDYRAFIEASPFVVLATSGPGGLDASPRGDPAGFVAVEDEKTLIIPDRRGNKRIDSLRNLIADDRIGLLFLIPGVAETLRVNGRAAISVDPALLARFSVDGKAPVSVLVVRVEAVYFQCSRALVRSGLRLTSLIPPQAMQQINEQMSQHGMSVDFANFKPEDIDELIGALREAEVKVDAKNGDTVRVFCA